MALKPLTILAALGAVYFVSSQSKAATPTQKKQPDNKPPATQVDWIPNPNLPNLDDDEEIELPEPPEQPDLPDLEEDQIPPPKGDLPQQEGQVIFKPNLADIYGLYLINNDEFPNNPKPEDLWISETCSSWGIGKNFGGGLPAKYVFENHTDPEKLIGAVEYWATHGGDISPSPHYIANLPNDVIYRTWARNLIQYYSGGKCGYNIPQRKDYDTYQKFNVDLQTFEKTPIGQLYKALYKQIGNYMYIYWDKQYPDKALEEDLRYGALWSVRNFPTYSVDNQTDEAYKKLFSEDPSAPKKINPNNPKHKEYEIAWINLKQWIKGYRALIKQYGDAKDPLES